jgi:elongation factor Tu
MPGDHGNIRLTLFRKMLMTPGQSFTIRENGITVATGIVTERLKPVNLPLGKLSKLVVQN